MKIKSNGLVKVLVPAILVGGGFIAVKSYNSKPQEPATQATHAQTDGALKNLSPQELKALGIEGDTPQDTLKTIVGSLNAVRQQQDSLNKQNTRLLDENEKLRERNTNVSGQVNEAVQGVEKSYHARENQMRQQQNVLTSKINELTNKLQNAGKSVADKTKGPDGDIPLGLGLDGMSGGGGNSPTSGSDGLMWVTPQDSPSTSLSQNNSASASSAGEAKFPTSFLSENALTKQKGSYEQQVKGSTSEKGEEDEAEPVYTLPENSTLIGSRAMTALLGRVPINGTVTDPYPFKVLIGKDNLTANGIELPDVEGAIVSGTASGDWTLSCVRGQVNSVTFVFTDGTVRTLPKPDRSGKGGNSGNQNGGKETGTSGGIGWISDENGIPCISGTRKSNASSYLPTIGLLGAAGAAGDAIGQNQQTSQTNAYGGVTSTLTGDAGQAVLGKAISGSSDEITEWVKQRYGQTFDAIYVQPGAKLAVHITRELAIDYEDKGRRVRYDFTMPSEDGSTGGLD
ncbi:TIGR03752 family integrating conjugative element protein [Erwinia amylovora]|uniref:Putative exported protein n=2 Tax=Erwinia amylovora TaxID=552 RepID=I1VYQ4_ERWAM|nr:TIGR03752 family integrating conjugative element protein [Erwinia amylovora]AEX08425.1 integrating conjugative element protein, PFL_4705 family [Erwinia amylovora ACW56400]AFI56296.1 putative exported protein [Erwinia amylovora]MCK8164515.1 TIGR03752 family integrating conjugative element protein [Erwinia amylovora]MCK8184726.1 TIGR03752 family integrating conjugative element protein [Erwinia amylovora]MCK8188047.1 TIGR03752 family integrating conjugative element protein [Erwinia amylovora]